MLRLEVEDHSLDLKPGTRITVRRQNPAYLGEDVGKIKGDFSYPFTLPLTDRNRRILRYPERLDSAERPRQDLRANLFAGAELLLSGKLAVQAPTRTEARCYIFSNPLKDLTKVKLNETEQGELAVDGRDALTARMLETVNDPLARDYLFAPVYNVALRDDDEFIPPASDFINGWNFDGQYFLGAFNVTPFLRVEPMLKKAMEGAGYSWTDYLHTSNEMRRQVLVSSRSMSYEDRLSYRLPLNMCLPSTSLSDFLKSICLTYCCAPFSELNGDHVSLVPLRTLVHAPPRTDWSPYASREYTRSPDSAAVGRYEWPGDAYEPGYYFSEWSSDHPQPIGVAPDFVDEENDPIALPVDGVLYFYGRSAVSIPKRIRGLLGREWQNSFGYVENDRGTDVVSPTVSPAQTHIIYSFPSNNDETVMPTVSMSMVGIQTAPVVVPAEYGVITSESGSVSVRLSFFRGMQRTRNGQLFPMLNHEPSNSYFRQLEGDEVSLNWLGPNGLYERWWQEWDDMLANSGIVTRNFRLPLVELLRFDFKDKVRVENQNYFVRSLEFTVGADVGVTKCTLVSVS